MAETSCTPFHSEPDGAGAAIVRRSPRPVPSWPSSPYRYHGCITDREGETLELEADHRRHAEIENAIRDLKYGVGLNHLPSGRFPANGAWLAVQVMAHNLARWTARIGLGEQVVTTKTLRRRFFSIDGRLTRWRAASLCICHSVGPGKPSSVTPWHDSPMPLASQAPSSPDPLTGQPIAPPTRTNSVRRDTSCLPPIDPAPHGRPAAIIVPVWLPHAALIPIYWNLARPVRLPLPIIPGINDRDVSLRWIRAKPQSTERMSVAAC